MPAVAETSLSDRRADRGGGPTHCRVPAVRCGRTGPIGFYWKVRITGMGERIVPPDAACFARQEAVPWTRLCESVTYRTS